MGNYERIAAERTNELILAKDRAEHESRSLSAYLSMLSHEIRTPLNAILGFTELVQLEIVDNHVTREAVIKHIEYVHKAGAHLLGLVNKVLDIAKLKAGQMEINPVEIDLVSHLRSVIGMVSEEARSAYVQLHMAVEPGAYQMRADEQMLTEMLLNILANAIKFAPGGYVTLAAMKEDGGGLKLIVSDTGCGIPSDKLQAVFTPYEQVDNHFRRSLHGTGLGLTLVREMMTLHRGRISIISVEGTGTIVTLWFPPSQHWETLLKHASYQGHELAA